MTIDTTETRRADIALATTSELVRWAPEFEKMAKYSRGGRRLLMAGHAAMMRAELAKRSE